MDAFWSQETSTVSGNFRILRGDYFGSVYALSIRRPVPIIGTDKVRDRVGMVCAIHTMWCGGCYHPCPEYPFRVQTTIAAGDEKSEDLETE